ncbi:MAG: hypothetical protein V1819_03665 [bacterium]
MGKKTRKTIRIGEHFEINGIQDIKDKIYAEYVVREIVETTNIDGERILEIEVELVRAISGKFMEAY